VNKRKTDLTLGDVCEVRNTRLSTRKKAVMYQEQCLSPTTILPSVFHSSWLLRGLKAGPWLPS